MLDIYYHPTCASSHRVIRELSGRNLLPKVRLISVSRAIPDVLGGEIWSVPWIVENGVPLATDPIDPEEAAGIVENGRAKIPDDGVKAFMSAVLSSLYATSLVYVHDSLRPVMSTRFAAAALRSALGGPDPRPVMESAARDERAILEKYRGKLVRVLSYGLMRIMWWSRGGSAPPDPPDEHYTALWLLSTVSLGRAGLPERPQRVLDVARELADAMKGDFDRLTERIGYEQSEIMGDMEYWGLLAAGSSGMDPAPGREI